MAMLSSPLAAMRPPPCPTGRGWVGYGQDVGESLSRKAASNSFGRSTGAKFNFAELAMASMGKDYFSQPAGPIRGSSPSASLAADLSQNFCIDQSPQFPTPRRSLFTSGLFTTMNRREGVTTPPIRSHWEGATTPPVPSSSPGCFMDAMDVEMSPLPHKLPFSVASRQIAESPSRKLSLSNNDEMVPPPRPTSFPPMESRPTFAERKKSHLQRPLLSRTKCMSTSQILPRQRENQLPPFTFGAGVPPIQSNTQMSIDEAFAESPSQPRNMFSSHLPSIQRPRFQLSHTNVMSRGNGSPFTKKQPASAPAAGPRPRKQFRRTLSMFEHPADVMKTEKKETTLDAVMDIDEVYELRLPNFVPEDKPNSLPRINQETMIQVLNGDYKQQFDNVMVIDCRFEYEYNGGHIDGAANYNDKESLARHLFDTMTNKTLLVLHCEYSAHRAPMMAQYIREQDRSYNVAQYPRLSYPEMYILDGGYSAFFRSHSARCYPQNYVEMEAKEHEEACERGLNRVRQRSKLHRAATYAFGQHCPPMQNSPSRPGSSSKCEMDTDLFMPRIHPRRSASS